MELSERKKYARLLATAQLIAAVWFALAIVSQDWEMLPVPVNWLVPAIVSVLCAVRVVCHWSLPSRQTARRRVVMMMSILWLGSAAGLLVVLLTTHLPGEIKRTLNWIMNWLAIGILVWTAVDVLRWSSQGKEQ